MKTWFEAIGYRVGQTAAKARDLFDLLGGGAEESLAAEIRLGHDLAAAMLARVQLVEENPVTRYASDIGRWLAGNPKAKKIPFTFRVTAKRAWCGKGPCLIQN